MSLEKEEDKSIKKSFRLSKSTIKQLEEWKRLYNRLNPKKPFSDSDIMRIALTQFLESELPHSSTFQKCPPELREQLEEIYGHLKEFLPIFNNFKRIKDPELILQLSTPIAAKTLISAMIFGEDRGKVKSAEAVLDRVLGKPVERQISINANQTDLNDPEANNKLAIAIDALRSSDPEEFRKLFKDFL